MNTLQTDEAPLILVIDDDENYRDTLVGFLEQSYRVMEASGGMEGLALCKEHKPNLILLDAEMPVMDGFEVCSTIRQTADDNNVPTIMMITSHDDISAIEKAFQTGVDEFVTKPVRFPILRHRIQVILKSQRIIRQELTVREKLFQTISESSQDAIIVTDQKGLIIIWNQGAEKIFQYPRDQIVGQPVTRLLPYRYRQQHKEGMAQVKQNISSPFPNKTWEVHGVRRDGSEFPLELSLSMWESGEEVHFSAIVRDISLKKAMEEEKERLLQNQVVLSTLLYTALKPTSLKQQLSEVLEIILSVNWLSLDAKGSIFLFDEEKNSLVLAAQHGMDDTLISKCDKVPLGECLCGKAAQEKRFIYTDCIDDRHSIQFEGMEPHGHYCLPILFFDRLIGILNLYLPENHKSEEKEILFLTDITNTLAGLIERRRVEEELKMSNVRLDQRVKERTADLQQANKELEFFASSVSHDLRAPLRSINGFSEILQEESAHKLNTEELGFLDNIREGCKEMNELIEGLLMLSRLTQGKMEWEKVSLSELAHEISNRFHEQEPERQVSIKIQPDLTAHGDSRLLKTLMENLIGNAWKYSLNAPVSHISFQGQEKEGSMVYFISDNGAGFDMNYCEEMFKPFFRLHSQQEFEGTGIGLATVQRIVSRHNGRIWAESIIGEGATFYFTLGHPLS